MSKNNQMEKLLFGALMPFRWPKEMQVSHLTQNPASIGALLPSKSLSPTAANR